MKYLILLMSFVLFFNTNIYATEELLLTEVTTEEVSTEAVTTESIVVDELYNSVEVIDKLEDIESAIEELANVPVVVNIESTTEFTSATEAEISTEVVTTEESTTEATTTEVVTTEESTTEDYTDVLIHNFIEPDDTASDSKVLRKIYNLLLLIFVFMIVKFIFTDCRAWFNKLK